MIIEVTIKARAAVKTRQISALLHFVHPQIDDFCIAFAFVGMVSFYGSAFWFTPTNFDMEKWSSSIEPDAFVIEIIGIFSSWQKIHAMMSCQGAELSNNGG